MQLSIVGLLICAAIWLIARRSAEPAVFALITSFAFGSTAIVILPALGGSSPIIYVMFLGILLATVALRPNAIGEIVGVFARQPTAWAVLFLILYVIVGAMLLPRLFAGETTVFVPLREQGRMAEIPLMPVSGNITQTLYFVFGALAYFGFSVLMQKPRAIVAMRQGLFAWATLHVSFGVIDLMGKLGGLGDVLSPIRTASYAMLTDVDVAGFWRIAGAYSEASAFGGASVGLLAYMFTYWRASGSRFAFALCLALLCLLVLSTSSTAYAGGGMLAIILAFMILAAAIRNQLRAQDLLVLAGGVAALTAVVGIVLYNEHALDPLWRLFDTMVLDKASSSSAQERFYWNYRSLQSVYDTVGLGVGLGSSRASSWLIAVISQLGVTGAVIIAVLVFQILRGGRLRYASGLDPQARITALSLRASTLAGLIAGAISGGSANPGVMFFITLATLGTLMQEASRGRDRRFPIRGEPSAIAPRPSPVPMHGS